MLVGDSATLGLGMDFGVLIARLALLVWIGSRMCPHLIT
jgi:energy-converting hydrogenase Eha subunit B